MVLFYLTKKKLPNIAVCDSQLPRHHLQPFRNAQNFLFATFYQHITIFRTTCLKCMQTHCLTLEPSQSLGTLVMVSGSSTTSVPWDPSHGFFRATLRIFIIFTNTFMNLLLTYLLMFSINSIIFVYYASFLIFNVHLGSQGIPCDLSHAVGL